MTATLLALLAENPQGLTLAQLPEGAGRELGPLLADGRVTLDTSSGVDVYRSGKAPEAPKAKAAPTSRMVPIALLDGLADALDEPRGTLMSDLVKRVETLVEQLDAAARKSLEVPDALVASEGRSPPGLSYTPPAPWVAQYIYDDGKSFAKVTASGKRWEWTVDDGGTGEAATLEKAIRIADAVRALS